MKLIRLYLLFLTALAINASAGQFYFNGSKLIDLDLEKNSARDLSPNFFLSAYFGQSALSGDFIIGKGEIQTNPLDDYIQGYTLYRILSDGSEKQIGKADSVIIALPSPVSDDLIYITKDNHLFLIDSRGNEKQLIPDTKPVTQANWSPDGQKIVFVGWPEGWKYSIFETAKTEEEFNQGMESDIFVLNIKSGDIQQLTQTPKQDFKPIWSPDGQTILFVSARTRFLSFFTMDIDGNNQTQITNIDFKRDRSHIPVQTNNIIQWNPKEKGLAYQTSIKAYEKTIWYIQKDGSDSKMLGSGTNPQWDNTGTYLIFTQPDGNISIWNSKANSIQILRINQ